LSQGNQTAGLSIEAAALDLGWEVSSGRIVRAKQDPCRIDIQQGFAAIRGFGFRGQQNVRPLFCMACRSRGWFPPDVLPRALEQFSKCRGGFRLEGANE
jgi:hypothetical protein